MKLTEDKKKSVNEAFFERLDNRSKVLSGIRNTEGGQKLKVKIGGIDYHDFHVRKAQFPGVCRETGRSIGANDEVAWGFLPTDRKWVRVLWPQEDSNVERPFIPNAEQQVLIDYWLKQKKHVAGIAGAGSGKTTVAMHIVKVAREHGIGKKVHFVCFNRKNREDISAKLEKIPKQTGFQASATTMHSLCFGYVKKQFKDIKFQSNKDHKLWNMLTDEDDWEQRSCYKPVMALTQMAKSTFTHWEDRNAINALINNPIAPIELPERADAKLVVDLAQQMLRASLPRGDNHIFGNLVGDEKQIVDFNDMIYWTANQVNGIAVSKITHLFVDETQDMSRSMLKVIMLHEEKGAHVTVIGDPLQEICGYATGSIDNMQDVVNALKSTKRGCMEFPLPINQRCSKSVVVETNPIWPNLRPRHDAPQGAIGDVDKEAMLQRVQPGMAIISRTNAPLANCLVQLLKSGKPVRLVGGQEAASTFNNLIKQVCKRRLDMSINEMLANLDEYEHRQEKKLMKDAGGSKEFDEIRDKCDAIRYLAAIDNVRIEGRNIKVRTSKDLMNLVDALVIDSTSDEARAVNIMTGHRAKGSEYPVVFNLTPELFPHPRCETDEQIRADMYLLAVVISRAKLEYYRVSGFTEVHNRPGFDEYDDE